MEFAFSLEGTGVHHLDGDGLVVVVLVVFFVVREAGAVDGAKAPLSKAARGGERTGSTPKDGVGEPVWRLRVGWSCTFSPDFAEAHG